MTIPAPLRLALRDWDWLTPLRLGEVPGSEGVSVTVVDDLPAELVLDPAFDAVEMSFAQAARRLDEGDMRVVSLPCFPMRGFRHRCALVRADSELRQLPELKGLRIGMTGWQDTGSTWIRGASGRGRRHRRKRRMEDRPCECGRSGPERAAG
ncbi:hypothetical protein [Aureimonas populi]|uniref:Uncharacterized protein n=1 Tax=Aureimonas populi TaxID=1701758 RepID=A0ABW5CK78_9HYPH|nr:hypothetical protein [Aureimonas populi]